MSTEASRGAGEVAVLLSPGCIFLVRDGRVVTAQPWAYRAYAAEVARALGVVSDAAAARLAAYVTERSYGNAVTVREEDGAPSSDGGG